MDIISNNTTIYFKYTVWFSQSLYATSGTIHGYNERNKQYNVLTKHGYCKLDRSDFELSYIKTE